MIDQSLKDSMLRLEAQIVDEVLNGRTHASDCAVHNAPALPVGPCDCKQELTHALRLIAKHVEANGAAWAKSVALQALEESSHT